ncbi:MAG: ketopantoate reductase family protein [Bryobacteraceae bacterium]
MRIAIAGAGAVGAYLGAALHRAGQDVRLLARGAQLGAIAARGVRVTGASEFQAHPPATGDANEIGPVDVVFLGVKAHSLTELAPRLAPLLGPETAVVTLQNGVPWWYFADLPLERVDPGGVIAAAIERRRVVGGIVYLSVELMEPGVVRHVAGSRITIGEPGGERTGRCRLIAQALAAAGLRCPVTAHIREEIWVKVLGNMAFNPMSALGRATLDRITGDPDARALARAIMEEGEAVSAKLGMRLPVGIEQRLAGAAKVGAHKTSMLQDLEAGRRLELEPIVGAVLEIGDRLGIAMPATRAVYACARLLQPVQ